MSSKLIQVRNQLSHCLYQHDAATRVISRLIKQRDKALQEVELLQKQLSNSTLIDNEPGKLHFKWFVFHKA